MKLYETILFSLTLVLLVIGLHQTAVNGFVNSYWIFMLMFITMIIYRMRKNKVLKEEEIEKKHEIKNPPLSQTKEQRKKNKKRG